MTQDQTPTSHAHRSSEDDFDLLTAAARGDDEAIVVLLRHHYRDVWNFIHRYQIDKSEVDDLTQEVFIKVFRSTAGGKAQFRGESTFKTWLVSIAINVCAAHARRKARRGVVAAVYDPPDSQPTPEENLFPNEILRQWAEAVGEKRFAVLREHIIVGRTLDETAEHLNIPRGTARTHFRSAIEILRKKGLLRAAIGGLLLHVLVSARDADAHVRDEGANQAPPSNPPTGSAPSGNVLSHVYAWATPALVGIALLSVALLAYAVPDRHGQTTYLARAAVPEGVGSHAPDGRGEEPDAACCARVDPVTAVSAHELGDHVPATAPWAGPPRFVSRERSAVVEFGRGRQVLRVTSDGVVELRREGRHADACRGRAAGDELLLFCPADPDITPLRDEIHIGQRRGEFLVASTWVVIPDDGILRLHWHAGWVMATREGLADQCPWAFDPVADEDFGLIANRVCARFPGFELCERPFSQLVVTSFPSTRSTGSIRSEFFPPIRWTGYTEVVDYVGQHYEPVTLGRCLGPDVMCTVETPYPFRGVSVITYSSDSHVLSPASRRRGHRPSRSAWEIQPMSRDQVFRACQGR